MPDHPAPPRPLRARIVLVVASTLFAVVFVGGPGWLVEAGVSDLHHGAELRSEGIPVRGVVTDEEAPHSTRSTTCSTAQVTYRTRTGQVETHDESTDGCLDDGTPVTVVYDPHHPGFGGIAGQVGGPSASSSGKLSVGIGIFVLYALLALRLFMVRRWQRRGLDEEHGARLPRPLAANVVGALVAVASLVVSVYAGFGRGNLGVGVVAALVLAGALSYVASPPGLRGRTIGGPRRLRDCPALVVPGVFCFLVAFTLPAAVTDTWLGVVGQPVHGTVTHVEDVYDVDHVDDRNYVVRLDSGRVLPLGDISQDDVGERGVGQRVTLLADPTGFVATPRAGVRAGSAEVVLVLVGLLGLAACWAWGVVRDRRDLVTPERHPPVLSGAGSA